MRREDVVADLTKALGEGQAQGPAPTRYDAVILGPVEESVFYEVVADKLKAMVQAGTGLIYTAIPPRKVMEEGEKKPVMDPAFEKELTAAPITTPPPILAQGIPYAALPGFRLSEKDKEKDYRKVADASQDFYESQYGTRGSDRAARYLYAHHDQQLIECAGTP